MLSQCPKIKEAYENFLKATKELENSVQSELDGKIVMVTVGRYTFPFQSHDERPARDDRVHGENVWTGKRRDIHVTDII